MKTIPMILLALCAVRLSAADFTGPNRSTSAGALTNMMVAAAAGSKAYDITVVNTSASDVWVLAFDSATNKANGSFTSMAVKVEAGKTGGFYWATGRPFRNGITVAGSTTMPALTNTSTVLTIDVTYLDRTF